MGRNSTRGKEGSLIFRCITLPIGLSALAKAACAGSILFSTFSPGFGFDTTSGNFVGNSNVAGNQVIAQQFVPSESAQFGAAVLALGESFPNLNPSETHLASIYLESDAGGLPSGVIIDQVDAIVTVPWMSLVTLNSSLHPLLTAGTPYWLVADAVFLSGPSSNTLLYLSRDAAQEQGLPTSALCNGNTSSGGCGTNGPWTLGSAAPGIERTAFQIEAALNLPLFGCSQAGQRY